MTEPIVPNPHSPYADANPNVRHLFASFLGVAPTPGVLALAACERLAVVPDGPLTDATTLIEAGEIGALPAGLCPTCVGVAAGDETETEPPTPGSCRECGMRSRHGDLCALCRQDLHEQWWPTRDQPTDPTT